MSYGGKLRLEGAHTGQPYSRKDSRPRVDCAKSAIKMNSTIIHSDLYLNPDPLVRLIGEPNKAIVKIEGQKFDSLIDSGAQISQLTESLVKALDLKNSKFERNTTPRRSSWCQNSLSRVCRGSIG